VRLLEVEATDFLSYRHLLVDLTGVHQLAVVGKNGHGKSAILDAILWCLFAKGRGPTDEMIREGCQSTYVRTLWERTVDGQPTQVSITRSRTSSDESSLAVVIDGEVKTKSKIPLTQAYIEVLMGMGPKAMMAGPIMVQGDSAALLDALPAARKDLLVELFQLDRWEGYHEEAKRQRKGISVRQDLRSNELVQLESELGDYDELSVLRELQTLHAQLADQGRALEAATEEAMELRSKAAILQERAKRAQALSAEIEALLEQMGELAADNTRLVQGIDRATSVSKFQIPDIPPEPSDAAVIPIRVEMTALDASLSELRSAVSTFGIIRQQIPALASRASASSPCVGDPPGCQYVIAAAAAAKDLAELRDRCDALEAKADELPALEASRLILEKSLAAEERRVKEGRSEHYRVATEAASLTAQRDSALAYLAEAEPQLKTVQKRMKAVELDHRKRTKERLQLTQDEWSMADLASKITESTAAAKLMQEHKDVTQRAISATEHHQARMSKLKQQGDTLAAEIAAGDGEGATLDILIKAFHRDGIPTLILETALPEIEARANDVLSRLPDDYSIRLDTKAATKTGTFKDELNVTVLTGGRERPYRMLSGGQRFRVDFAMRIALAAVIASRVEATVDTLWLDEPLGPLDREGQEAVADTLAAVSDEFGLIVVVSHVADFNDRFESKLAVTMEDGESYAVLA